MATPTGGNGGANSYPNPQQQYNSGGASSGYTAAVIIIVSVLLVVALVRLARFILGMRKKEHDGRGPGAAGGSSVDVATGAGAGAPSVRQVAVAVEVQAGPVVCAYRRRDGWREATCPVCLSEFADGETVRVLPVCMHYFHAACVDEWLRANTTCPLCRAAPPLPSPAGPPARPLPLPRREGRISPVCVVVQGFV